MRLDLFQNSRNIAFAKIWHFLALVALKDTKKPIKYWKRPTKAVKVILRARESKKQRNIDFITFLWSFGVKNEEDSVFWRFKVIKAKKATLVARKAKLHRSNAKNLWLVLYCQYVIIVLSQMSILLYFSDLSLLKAKIGLEGPKNERNKR